SNIVSLDALNAPVTKQNRIRSHAALGVFALMLALLLAVCLRSFLPPLLLCAAAGWAAWWQQKQSYGKQENGTPGYGHGEPEKVENAVSSVPLADFNAAVTQWQAFQADVLALQEQNRQLQAESDAQQALLAQT